MEKEELRYLKVEEVKHEGNFVCAVSFKPKMPIIICAVLGLALLFIDNLICRLLGAFVIIFAFFVFKEVEDYKVMDIFDKGIMVYGDKEAKLACFVAFDKISQWNIDRENGHDTVELTLDDNKVIYKDTFEASKVYRALYRLIKEKEKNYIRAQKNKYVTIPEAFENIKRRMKK